MQLKPRTLGVIMTKIRIARQLILVLLSSFVFVQSLSGQLTSSTKRDKESFLKLMKNPITSADHHKLNPLGYYHFSQIGIPWREKLGLGIVEYQYYSLFDSIEWEYKGSWEQNNDTLFLTPHGTVPKPKWFHVLHWDGFEILLNDNQIVRFANEFNSGHLIRYHGKHDARHLTMSYLSNIPAECVANLKGKPSFPEEFSRYLLDDPIIAEIVSVDLENHTMVLNKGKSDGVFEKMIFYPSHKYSYYDMVVVDAKQSSAIVLNHEVYLQNKARKHIESMDKIGRAIPKLDNLYSPKIIRDLDSLRYASIYSKVKIGNKMTTMDIHQ